MPGLWGIWRPRANSVGGMRPRRQIVPARRTRPGVQYRTTPDGKSAAPSIVSLVITLLETVSQGFMY